MVKNRYIGLSTDPKPVKSPINNVSDGSTFYCTDTSELYIYDSGVWYKQTKGGGGGTSDYAQLTNKPSINGVELDGDKTGDDLDLQDKLTAGANIIIDENNVISSTGGGGGGSYLAGDGIDISGQTISIDDTVVATKSEIPDVSDLATKQELTDGLADKQDTLTAGTGIEITNNEIGVDNTIATKAEIPDVSDLATKQELTDGLADKQDVFTTGDGMELTPSNVLKSTKLSADNSDKSIDVVATNGTQLKISLDGDPVVSSSSPMMFSASATLQKKLTAGSNITIDANNVISATGGSGGTVAFDDITNRPLYNGQPMTSGTVIPYVSNSTVVASNDNATYTMGGNVTGDTDMELSIDSSDGSVDLRVYDTVSQDVVASKTLQGELVSGTNIKTVANQSLLGSGDVEFKTINNSSVSGSGNLTTGKVSSDVQTNSTTIYEGTDTSIQISKDGNDAIRIQGYAEDDRGATQTLYNISLPSKTSKQDTLVSGTNIKTINNESILGSGNINIQGGNTPTVYWDDATFGYSEQGGDSFTLSCDQNTDREVYFTFRSSDPEAEQKRYTVPTQVITNNLQTQIDTRVGTHFAVGQEKWYGTYTDENNVTYQVYSKTVYIASLPATAGITAYDHGVSNIRQILDIYGSTTDGFVLNAPRQNVQDNITIYQASKNSANKTFSIEVGKDRSSKSAYVTMIYAKNN